MNGTPRPRSMSSESGTSTEYVSSLEEFYSDESQMVAIVDRITASLARINPDYGNRIDLPNFMHYVRNHTTTLRP